MTDFEKLTNLLLNEFNLNEKQIRIKHYDKKSVIYITGQNDNEYTCFTFDESGKFLYLTN